MNTVVDSPALVLLRDENADLERKIERARLEISELNVAETSSGGINGLYAKLQASKAKVKALREENLVAKRRKAEGGGGGGGGGAKARAEAAEARALELEAELLKVAREQASELTALQMQLLEKCGCPCAAPGPAVLGSHRHSWRAQQHLGDYGHRRAGHGPQRAGVGRGGGAEAGARLYSAALAKVVPEGIARERSKTRAEPSARLPLQRHAAAAAAARPSLIVTGRYSAARAYASSVGM